ncbi:MAG TPA: hopanoid biosynthesis-associated protein HpnK [Novosphingobium sp.]|nr:hopanoid biosynthesis-associated protein HpnK [Novosphingobium sp.]
MTADDFGAALAVNEAVERAHVDGILTAASLMVAGEGAADAVARARRLPGLGVGLHVVLVEGRPVLPAAQVPALVGPDGQFAPNMVRTAFRIAFSRRARAQMRAEVAAQFAAFAATGLPLDHVNAHKHFHLHPMIAAAILEAGRAHGLAAIRVPREGGGSGLGALLMRWWAGLLGRRWRRAGLATNDQVVGLAVSGAFTPERMRAALASLPEGITEIYTHPATADAYPGSAPGYAYRAELAALVDPVVCKLAGAVARGPFRALATLSCPSGSHSSAIEAA